jgi:hypothetical protein
MDKELKVTGAGFSQSGKKLLSIVDTEPNGKYTTALTISSTSKG